VFDLPRGVVVPLVTPLTEDETLDVVAFRKLLNIQIEAGVDGFFVLGSCGEGVLLTEEVRLEVAKTAVEVAGGAVPVYAAASNNSIATVKPGINRLVDAGVSAVVLTLPFYGWYNDQSCAVDFFCEIADFSPIPVIAYNLPRVAGTSLSLESILAIADHPNIIALKDTRPEFEEMLAVASCKERQGKISYLVGNTVLAGSLLRAGADGLVSTMGNVYPHLIQRLWQSHNKNHHAMVETCTKLIAEFNPVFSMPTTPASTKWALELAGIGKARTVRPWPMPNAEQRENIRRIMNGIDRQLSEMGIARIASHACGLC